MNSLRALLERVVFSLMMIAKALLSPVAFGVHAMIFDHDGRVLLARHSYEPSLSFPGGGVNRGEPPVQAVTRELREELGNVQGDPPIFVGLYSRRAGWATNVIALYRVMNAKVEFRPNLEIREIVFVDPANPPQNTSQGTMRRLAEYVSRSEPSSHW